MTAAIALQKQEWSERADRIADMYAQYWKMQEDGVSQREQNQLLRAIKTLSRLNIDLDGKIMNAIHGRIEWLNNMLNIHKPLQP